MKDLQDVVKRNPGSIVFARYAEQLARSGKINEALIVLAKGIEANPWVRATRR